MQFTPQQLSGGQRFSPATRVGNWYEDISLEESKVQDFQNRSKSGNSQLTKLREKIAKSSQTVYFELPIEFRIILTYLL